jgi:hypothetical protein
MRPPDPKEPVSAAWWLLPFFFALIGGLVGYFLLKDRNRRTATNILIFGAVWTFVGIIFLVALIGFLFGLFGSFTSAP